MLSKNSRLQAEKYLFILKIARMFPILKSRNRLINTFIIVFPYKHTIDKQEEYRQEFEYFANG